MARTHSDDSREDKGYNRNHRQTEGGLRAYSRGERPKSLWNKKDLLNDLEIALNGMSENRELLLLCRETELDVKGICEVLNKQKYDTLFNHLLEVKGSHYTGNFYQYTLFYGLKEFKDMWQFIYLHLLPYKKKFEQVKLF